MNSNLIRTQRASCDLELRSPPANQTSFNSSRSSLDVNFDRLQRCEIQVHDDAPADNSGDFPEVYRVSNATLGVSGVAEILRKRLKTRDPTKTRWINIVGWSSVLVDEVANYHLGNHNCLDLDNASMQMLGGPTDAEDGGKFIWLQTQIWFKGKRAGLWSSMRQTLFRMIVCLPTMSHAGTLITNYVGPISTAKEISGIFTERLLENHPLGQQTLSCAWILAFSLLRTMAEQLDFAFEILDPIDSSALPSIPRLRDLPLILEKANRLARIDRYLSGLEEFALFFISVQRMPLSEQILGETTRPFSFNSQRVTELAKFEASRAQNRISYEQRLCRTYMKQFENLVQMVISYSATQITERLDQGSKVAEQFAKIGMLIAGITGIISPLSLLTSFYGMNVQEFTSEASVKLFEVWQVGLPILLAAIVCFVFIVVWMMTSSAKSH